MNFVPKWCLIALKDKFMLLQKEKSENEINFSEGSGNKIFHRRKNNAKVFK